MAILSFNSFQAVIDRGVVLGVYENESRELGLAEDAFTDATKKFNARTSGRLREMIRL